MCHYRPKNVAGAVDLVPDDQPAARAAPLAEVVRLYGLRHWVEQGYKQMKDQLGWADFMVRSDRPFAAIGYGCAVPLPFAGGRKPGKRDCTIGTAPRCGEKNQTVRLPMRCRWPRLLRSVRAWLTPLHWLTRCWRACFAKPLPAELAALVEFLIGKDGSTFISVSNKLPLAPGIHLMPRPLL